MAKINRFFDWLLKHRLGMVLGALAGAVLGVISVTTGAPFMVFAFPGVFFGGFFIGGNALKGLVPTWAMAFGVVVNVIFFAIIGAWIESLVKKR